MAKGVRGIVISDCTERRIMIEVVTNSNYTSIIIVEQFTKFQVASYGMVYK